MTLNKDARKSRKKLTLKKETIRDLATKKATSDVVRGGAGTVRHCP